MNNVKRLVFVKEIVSVMKNLPKPKTPDTGVHERTLPKTEETAGPVPCNLSRKIVTEGGFPNRPRPASPSRPQQTQTPRGGGPRDQHLSRTKAQKPLTTAPHAPANGAQTE